MARRKRDTTTWTLVALAVLVWAAAGYFAWTRVDKPAPAASAAVADAPPATAPPSASARTEPASAAPRSSEASPPATSAAPAPEDVDACVSALFPASSFAYKKPTFAAVCQESDPLKGGTEVRSQLVLGGGGNVTDGMRVWAGLGWYEMAALFVLRGRCCASPPEPAWAFKLACPVDDALARIEASVQKRDGAALGQALDDYTEQVRCLHKQGQGRNFGLESPPGAGLVGVKKLLERAGIELN